MVWFLGIVIVLGVAALVFALCALISEKIECNKSFLHFVGGLNIFIALFLFLMTIAMLIGPRILQGIFGVGYSSKSTYMLMLNSLPQFSAIGIALALIAIWATWGLVQKVTNPGRASVLLTGHVLLAIGSVPYGAVTFFLPILVFIGLVTKQQTAVLPWFGFVLFPISVVLWLIGVALVLASRPNSGLQPTPSSGRG